MDISFLDTSYIPSTLVRPICRMSGKSSTSAQIYTLHNLEFGTPTAFLSHILECLPDDTRGPTSPASSFWIVNIGCQRDFEDTFVSCQAYGSTCQLLIRIET
jgi:hypothetical protein